MSRLSRAFVLGLVLVAAPLLAGCTSDEPAVTLETLSLGIISGVVTDVGLKPLEGAVVRLDGANDSVTTDATGAFSLRVQPAEYLVLASFEGHRGGALRAAPGAGETARLSFVLAPLPQEKPEILVAEQHGLLSCGASLVVAEQSNDIACGSSDPNQRARVAFAIGQTQGLSGAVVEVTWEAHTPTASWFDITIATGEGERATILAKSEGDGGHVTISIPARVLDGAVTPAGSIAVEVAPTGSLTDEEAGLDAGAVFQQPFTVYLSLFYHHVQPTGYSVLQDA